MVGRLSESLYCEARVGKEKITRQVFKVWRYVAFSGLAHIGFTSNFVADRFG